MFSQRQFINITLLFLVSTLTWSEEPPDSFERTCLNSSLVSVPSRPTVTNSTDVTKCGVVELEFGLERQWPGGGANRDDLSGGLRVGLTHDLDFHWSSADFLHVMDGAGDRTGFGDTWMGLKYRLARQTSLRPSFGVFYQVKVPSASVINGLGSGQVDHSIAFLVSKDVGQIHVDFNVISLLARRPDLSGLDHNFGFALSSAVPITKRLSVVTEPYGFTSLNDLTPAFASLMAGLIYGLNPRLALDGGADFGVTHDAPRKRVWVGVTYAIANVYSWMRPSQ